MANFVRRRPGSIGLPLALLVSVSALDAGCSEAAKDLAAPSASEVTGQNTAISQTGFSAVSPSPASAAQAPGSVPGALSASAGSPSNVVAPEAPAVSMSAVSTAAVAASAAVSAGPVSSGPVPVVTASASASSAPSAKTGAELYVAHGCETCHGPDGTGTLLGPELQHPDRDHAIWAVRTGVYSPRLDKYKASTMLIVDVQKLPNAELDSIIGWLQSLPKPSTGQALYADHCAACHGPAGKGGLKLSDGPPITLEAYVKNNILLPSYVVTNAGNTKFADFVRKGYEIDNNGKVIQISDRRRYMPAFPKSASNGEPNLSDAEVDLIAAWLATQ